MASSIDFSIIVPTHNRSIQLTACLEAIACLRYARERFELIVVDDGSREPVEPAARQFRDRVLKRDTEIKERDQIARELAREREAAARAAADGATGTTATTNPVLTDQGTIAIDEGELRPPATRSGSDTPDRKPATLPSPTSSPSSSPSTQP